MTRSVHLLLWILSSIAFSRNYVSSSPSSTRQSLSSTILAIHGGSNATASSSRTSRQPNKSSVTFLYELHEHEIYNPQTSSWTSRRFTQSPITGGGGRDSTSLDPSSCSPPKNYLWDGEWKIDMTGEMRDGFGWEYYVGRFDGLGRRRRRWVRNLRRIGEQQSVPIEAQLARNATKATISSMEEKKMSPTLLRMIIDQYNFKGFGWSFTKSLIWKQSFGATFRIPLSSNFEFLDRYAAIPFASWTTYFGHPWVVATFLNASLPLEAIEWVIGGFLWKIKWSLAVASALVRTVIDLFVWIIMTPWRTWLTLQQIMSNVARKHVSKSGMAQSLIDSINAEHENDDDSKPINTDTDDSKLDGLIEMSTASLANKDIGEIPPVSTSAVVGSPRGGAFGMSRSTKRFRTMLGYEVPKFHRSGNIEYSSTISQRVGVCVSWRVSKERGYEYRWNFFCNFLPTQECWERLDKIATKKMNEFQKLTSKNRKSDGYESAPKTSIIKSFLYQHSATLGISSGYPLPVDPFFSLNLLLSTSGFYYGWLLKYIASILCVQRRPKDVLLANEIGPNTQLLATAKNSQKRRLNDEQENSNL